MSQPSGGCRTAVSGGLFLAGMAAALGLWAGLPGARAAAGTA